MWTLLGFELGSSADHLTNHHSSQKVILTRYLRLKLGEYVKIVQLALNYISSAGSITVLLTFCLTSLDSAALVMLN